MNEPKVDKIYSEVFKEIKEMSKNKVPEATGSPMNFNNKMANRAPMTYKGKGKVK
jgi:hypothetical protein